MLILCVIGFGLALGASILAMKMSRRVRYLEFFYEDILEDLEHSYRIFDTLVNRRSLLSDDPDIKQIKQVFAITMDILGDYLKNGRTLVGTATKRNKKAEEKEK